MTKAKADGGLRGLFAENMREVHWQPIETGSTGRGIPDVNACWVGLEIWIEFKKTDHWRVDLRPEQVGWIERRARAGGRCFIAVRRADDELWLMRSSAARILATESLREVPDTSILGRWYGGPRQWAWDAIKGLLFPVIP